MTMRVERFTPERVPAVKEFNRRLAAAGADWRFPEDPVPAWLPRTAHIPVFQEYFLLTPGDHVRGAYILKHQEASFRGELMPVGCSYWLLSEGTIDRAYAPVARQLVADAMRREPLLFAVGFEGGDTAIARLLRAMGWRLGVVPFRFKVLNGSRFLREIRYLRSTRVREWLLDLAAISGAGQVGATLLNLALTRRPGRSRTVAVEVVEEFNGWADELWRTCADRYSFVGARDSRVLNHVFPRGKRGLVRLKVTAQGEPIGYAVVKDAQAPGHEHFGAMRVGIILDCLADPADADSVIWGAAEVLKQRGVDLVFSNQTHPAWCTALRRAGFLPGGSRFAFATSRPLSDVIDRGDPDARAVHVNRGDGDLPWGSTLRVRAKAPE
jgi:hypothetical protein